ncbi:Pex19 protein family-domain-containing protein [Syncephalastrum racemosum]|uniref:Pex19 protein family-domain-containing protein n=1 Tax=Syncephalastrum racemosum TaxID=13706 RepID=A0A1X2HHX9_SYNRA|nr:Pex19 protein family-domain-containing protein [Syncephalastrum racemosum]
MSTSNSKQPAKEQEPDVDFDDDLLDDVLDDFNNLSTQPSAAPKTDVSPSSSSKEKAPQVGSESLDDLLDQDEFAKQLASGMEELMGGMDQDEEMKNTFEKIWKSFEENEKNADPSASSQQQRPSGPQQQSSFQDKIAQTMNKLKDSSKQVDDSIAEEGQQPDDAFMAEMMKQMESLAENGEFENVLEGMMQQLMSKELLYEPMKDLAARYPTWLAENKDKLSQSDYEKYEKQLDLCKQIVAKYEEPGFDEKNEAHGKEVMDLMQRMQDLGQPPAGMLEDMAPGMNLGADGIPEEFKDMENCNIM